jgi:hypothetical protein
MRGCGILGDHQMGPAERVDLASRDGSRCGRPLRALMPELGVSDRSCLWKPGGGVRNLRAEIEQAEG